MQMTDVDVWTVVVPTISGRVHSPEFGGAIVPDAPGLGCELDMEALEKYQITMTDHLTEWANFSMFRRSF